MTSWSDGELGSVHLKRNEAFDLDSAHPEPGHTLHPGYPGVPFTRVGCVPVGEADRSVERPN